MKKKQLGPGDEDVDVNLTPMIDVTFQLLIFFMVTSEMAKLDNIKDLQLPKADKATPDLEPPRDRLVVNIVEVDGAMSYIIGGDPRTYEDLAVLIHREATRSAGQDGFSSRPVLIRADKRIEYRHVQKVMNMLMDEQIWKMSFGAAKKIDQPKE